MLLCNRILNEIIQYGPLVDKITIRDQRNWRQSSKEGMMHCFD